MHAHKLVYKVLTALSLCPVLGPNLKYDLQVDVIVFPVESDYVQDFNCQARAPHVTELGRDGKKAVQ